MIGKYEDKRETVKHLINKGLTKKEVAEQSGIPYGSLSYFLRKWDLKVARNRNKYEHLREEIERLAKEGCSYYKVSGKLNIPLSTSYYLFRRWKLVRSKRSKYADKKDAVAEMLRSDMPVTKICAELGIPKGSIGYLLAKWGLEHLQLKRRGISFSPDGKRLVSEKAKARHKALKYMKGVSHPMYGLLKVRGFLVSEEEVEIELSEYVEQDLILAQMAKKMGVIPRTITNRLRRFGLQRGMRKGKRCSWYKGGYRKTRGPDWLTLREEILERDEYKCCHCGTTQEEARQRGHTLSIHHIAPWRETHDNSPDNLITLCQSCHMKMEWQSGCWRT